MAFESCGVCEKPIFSLHHGIMYVAHKFVIGSSDFVDSIGHNMKASRKNLYNGRFNASLVRKNAGELYSFSQIGDQKRDSID